MHSVIYNYYFRIYRMGGIIISVSPSGPSAETSSRRNLEPSKSSFTWLLILKASSGTTDKLKYFEKIYRLISLQILSLSNESIISIVLDKAMRVNLSPYFFIKYSTTSKTVIGPCISIVSQAVYSIPFIMKAH